MAPAAFEPGTRIGRYEILSLIATGGMGEVYRANDTILKRHVALKVLRKDWATEPEHLARFRREAELLAALNSPQIAQVFGLEHFDGTSALAMELVEGPTLAHRIADGPFSLDAALRLAVQIAQALEAAHARGIIHRDLKPSNIKVRPDGVVKVLDFGLAKSVDRGGRSAAESLTSLHTEPGTVLGTAAYMSPEQAAGKDVDRRTDLWSFGVILLEMLTGRRVFRGGTLSEVIAAVLRDEPDWEALPSNAPASLSRLLRRCLEKDTLKRIDSAADARLDIEHALESLAGASAATPTSAPPDRSNTDAIALRRISPEPHHLPDEPYPLLGPYQDPRTFAGRELEVRKLEQLVVQSPLVLCVHAPSGAGKTSLLLAGLVPRLRGAGYLVSVERSPVDPGVGARLLADVVILGPSALGSNAEEDRPEYFAAWIRRAREASGRTVILVLDQVDDILRDPERRQQAKAAIGPLIAATAERLPGTQEFGCKWLLCYRHEFHGEVRAWLEDVLVDARRLGRPGLDRLPFDLSDPQRSHDWALPVMAKVSSADAGGEAVRQSFLRAITQPLTLHEHGSRRYPYVLSDGDAARLADVFAKFRLEQPDAPLVPELQVVLHHLLERARAANERSGEAVVVSVPSDPDVLSAEIATAIEDHLRRALIDITASVDDARRLRRRSEVLLALRGLADADGRRGPGLLKADLLRMLGPDGERVLVQLASARHRLIIENDGVFALAHDRLAAVIASYADGDPSKVQHYVDRRVLDARLLLEGRSELYQRSGDRAALALGREEHDLIAGLQHLLLTKDAQRRWWEAGEELRRRRRITTTRRMAVAGAVAALVFAASVGGRFLFLRSHQFVEAHDRTLSQSARPQNREIRVERLAVSIGSPSPMWLDRMLGFPRMSFGTDLERNQLTPGASESLGAGRPVAAGTSPEDALRDSLRPEEAAKTLLTTGRTDEALERVKRLLRVPPKDGDELDRLVRLLGDSGVGAPDLLPDIVAHVLRPRSFRSTGLPSNVLQLAGLLRNTPGGRWRDLLTNDLSRSETRAAAMTVLGLVGDSRDAALLIPYLSGPEDVDRMGFPEGDRGPALEALDAMQDCTATPVVRRMVFDVRTSAFTLSTGLKYLRRCGNANDVGGLQNLAQRALTAPAERNFAPMSLADLADAAFEAAHHLSGGSPRSQWTQLVDRWPADRGRGEVANHLEPAERVPVLRSLLSSTTDPNTRAAAAAGLAELGEADGVSMTAEIALDEGQPRGAREASLRMLAWFRSPALRARLLALPSAATPDQFVTRAAVLRALRWYDDDDVVDRMLDALEGADPFVRSSAVDGLRAMSPERVAARLQRRAVPLPVQTQVYVSRALQATAHPPDASAFLAYIRAEAQSTDYNALVEAVRGLSLWYRSQVVAVAIAALRDRQPEVRLAATVALTEHREQGAVQEGLNHAAAEWPVPFRTAAARAAWAVRVSARVRGIEADAWKALSAGDLARSTRLLATYRRFMAFNDGLSFAGPLVTGLAAGRPSAGPGPPGARSYYLQEVFADHATEVEGALLAAAQAIRRGSKNGAIGEILRACDMAPEACVSMGTDPRFEALHDDYSFRVRFGLEAPRTVDLLGAAVQRQASR